MCVLHGAYPGLKEGGWAIGFVAWYFGKAAFCGGFCAGIPGFLVGFLGGRDGGCKGCEEALQRCPHIP